MKKAKKLFYEVKKNLIAVGILDLYDKGYIQKKNVKGLNNAIGYKKEIDAISFNIWQNVLVISGKKNTPVVSEVSSLVRNERDSFNEIY